MNKLKEVAKTDVITLTQLNIRYLAFEHEGEYFILDRTPRHLIGYLFFPLNWLFSQKIYTISKEEYVALTQKPRTSKAGISTVFIGGLAVVFGQSTKKYVYLLATNFSVLQTVIIFGVALTLASLCLYVIYRQANKSLTENINLTAKPIVKRRILPVFDKAYVSLSFIYLSFLFGGVIAVLLQFHIGNWAFIGGSFLAFFLTLMTASAFAYVNRCSYYVKKTGKPD